MSHSPMSARLNLPARVAQPATNVQGKRDEMTGNAAPATTAPLPWNTLMTRQKSCGKNDALQIAASTVVAVQALSQLTIRIDDSWLAKQRSRYNDEGDALLRAMLTVFRQGSPEANASATYDAAARLLEFDFLHAGNRYHARAVVHEDGRISDIQITDLSTPSRCLHMSEQADHSKTGAAFRRMQQRGSSSSSLYQMLHTETRAQPAPTAGQSGTAHYPAALASQWRQTQNEEELAQLLAAIAGLGLDPEETTLACFGLFDSCTGEAGKHRIAGFFTGLPGIRAAATALPASDGEETEARELQLLMHFAYAIMAAQTLPDLDDGAPPDPTSPIRAAAGVEEPDQGDSIARSLDYCIDHISRFHIDPDRIYRRMEAYFADYRRVLRELEKQGQALREKLSHREARAANLKRRQQREQGERDGQDGKEQD